MALALAMARAAAAGAASSIGGLQTARGWVVSLLNKNADCWSVSTVPASCRCQHIIPTRQEPSVVPEAILNELRQLESSLNAASRVDGRQRSTLQFSAGRLPAPLPLHHVEPGLLCLEAHVRPPCAVGGTASKWLRRSGRVPGRVHGLPQESGVNLFLHFDEIELGKMVRALGRNGCTAHVLQLHLVRPVSQQPQTPTQTQTQPKPPGRSQVREAPAASPAASPAPAAAVPSSLGPRGGLVESLGVLRVKPSRVQLNAVTQRLEGLDLLYCPADREVLVDVPVRLLNDDAAPGVKKGGWMYVMKRTVRYKALGCSIPPVIEVNVRHLDLEQEVLVRDLPIPPGTKLYEKDYNAPVLRCTESVGDKD